MKKIRKIFERANNGHRQVVIVLDFDGVVVESNDIKHQAFRKIFAEYQENFDEIMAYHFAHHAVSRHEKFAHISERILEIENPKQAQLKWLLEFQHLTRESVIDCPFVEGAKEFLDFFSERAVLYLASATPQSELDIILSERKLANYFKKIYGAPLDKSEVLKEIAAFEGIATEDLVFIGDSDSDFTAALRAKAFFIGRYSGHQFFDCPSFSNLKEISQYIEQGMQA